jgi:hypothetical protein
MILYHESSAVLVRSSLQGFERAVDATDQLPGLRPSGHTHRRILALV